MHEEVKDYKLLLDVLGKDYCTEQDRETCRKFNCNSLSLLFLVHGFLEQARNLAAKFLAAKFQQAKFLEQAGLVEDRTVKYQGSARQFMSSAGEYGMVPGRDDKL